MCMTTVSLYYCIFTAYSVVIPKNKQINPRLGYRIKWKVLVCIYACGQFQPKSANFGSTLQLKVGRIWPKCLFNVSFQSMSIYKLYHIPSNQGRFGAFSCFKNALSSLSKWACKGCNCWKEGHRDLVIDSYEKSWCGAFWQFRPNSTNFRCHIRPKWQKVVISKSWSFQDYFKMFQTWFE